MQTNLPLLALTDALEKQAGIMDSIKPLWAKLKQSIYTHPTLWATGVGAAAGTGLGAMIPSTDEYGKTHRLRNAMIGGLLGGGTMYGVGEYGSLSDHLQSQGFNDAFKEKRLGDLAEILRSYKLRHVKDPQMKQILESASVQELLEAAKILQRQIK